jgi:hypothetical protein
MRKTIGVVVLMLAGGFGSALLAQSKAPVSPFAQKLADEFTAKYVRVISIGIHAKPPNSADYVIIAHTAPKSRGLKSEDEDLAVMRTGKPTVSDPTGGVFEAIVPLHDASGKTIGALVAHVKPDGGSKEGAVKLGLQVRDELAKQIPSEAKLFESAN